MARTTSLPWIGVEACWPLYSSDPRSHLVSVLPEQMDRHGYVVGSTGSGKSVLLQHLMAQDLERGNSICVVDMRGDMVRAALELCSDRVAPHLVKVIDLREKVRPFGFNPLHGAGEPYYRALNVVEVVKHVSDSWGVQLEETMRNALLVLVESKCSLTDFEDFFFDDCFRKRCLSRVAERNLVEHWQRFESLSPERQLALATPVLNKLSALLSTPTLKRILGHQEPIDLGRHLNTKGSVLLVSLAVDELHGSALMVGSLLLAAICREIFARVSIPENRRNSLRLYVDEFQHFPNREFEQILAEGRRFKCSLILAHQTLAQLTPRMRSMILSNVALKFVFQVGYEDSLILGKDIFGDAKFYDFTELPVGHCVMWRKGLGDMEVEVNPPLLPNVGQLSREGADFVKRVYDHAPPYRERVRERVIEAEYRVVEELKDKHVRISERLPKPSLEDWL